jgi:hypothetical protein
MYEEREAATDPAASRGLYAFLDSLFTPDLAR